MNRHLILLPIIFSLVVVLPAFAGFHEGTSAYERGDYATAFKEFKVLAEQGNPEAQFNLGLMYHKGQGVPQDNDESVKWFRKAAEQQYVKAQYNLGAMYSLGQGVAKDNTEAVKWFRMAAEQGFAEAQYDLAVMYAMGQGVDKDFVQAHKWFNLAAEQGDSEAQKDRDEVAKMMTPTQIEEALRLAKEWKPTGNNYLPKSSSQQLDKFHY